jgi:hypothetical protein
MPEQNCTQTTGVHHQMARATLGMSFFDHRDGDSRTRCSQHGDADGSHHAGRSGGRERSFAEYDALLAKAGLRRSAFSSTDSPQTVIEAVAA